MAIGSKKRGSRVANLVRSKPLSNLSETGKRWLIQNLDPFHDEDFDPVGYPDLNGSKSIVQCQNLSMTVVAPGSVTGTATWDANIFSLPEAVSNSFVAGYNPGPNVGNPVNFNNNTNPFSLGIVNAVAVPAGQSTFTFGTTGTGTAQPNAVIQSVAPPTTWTIGNSRVVGLGFEITNVTATLNEQGAVTVYRQPQINTPTSMCYGQTAANNLAMTPEAIASRLPPLSVAEAKQLTNSKTWSAADGAYLVSTQYTNDNPMATVVSGIKKYSVTSTTYTDVAIYSNLYTSAVIPITAVPVTFTGGWAAWKPAPFNTAGAYFTGLSASTVLQVEVKVFMEKCPTSDDSAFLGFARPSPPLDDKAMQVYARIIDHLPVGVNVNENPFGEWFQRILKAVQDYGGETGIALSTVAGPSAAILGKAASVAARAANGIIQSTQSKLDSLNAKENKVAQEVKTLKAKVAKK